MLPGLVSGVSIIVIQIYWRNLPKMSRKCFTVDQVLDQVLSSDAEEGIENNDYENESDFER